MSDLDPTEAATTADLDPTTATAVPTSPVTAPPITPAQAAGTPGAFAAAGPTNPVEQPVEPAVAWAAAVPVRPPSQGGSGRGRRLRWAAAIAVIAIVLGASAAVAAFITGAASQSTVIGYVPADSLAYAEARLDLPGDQRKAVGEFLAHFPGFKDSAALDSKLDEALDQFIKDATDGKQTYTTDIKPWFGGELAFSLGPLPPASDFSNGGASAARQFRALGLLSVTDGAGAQAYFDKLSASTGEETTKQPYNGVQLTVYAGQDGPTLAYGVVGGKVVAIGDLASVKAAVDSGGNSGFAGEPGPKAALGAADQAHVGFVYVALRPLMDWSSSLSKLTNGAGSGGMVMEPISDALLKTIPDWASYWLRVEQNALVMEAVAPKPEVSIGSTESRTSTLVKHVPSSAMVMAVSNSLGQTLGQAIDLYKDQPAYKPLVDQLDQALGVVGGRDAALGWIGDTAIVVNDAGGTPEGGLLVAPTDSSKAKALFTSISTLIGIGGSQQGITVRTEDYNGATITIVDLGDLSKQLGASGAGNQIGGLPIPAGAHLEIAYAVTDDLVVIGTGPGFVKHVLDTNEGNSLASDSQYKDLAGRVGAGTGQSFVDITAVRLMIEKAAATTGTSSLSKYESDVKPFIEPFDAMFASGTYQGDLGRATVIISVK
jgi:Protein of unknown function (DUF3352)